MRSGNDDLADIAGKVDAIVRDMQAERERNRRNFPLMAEYLKLLDRFNPRAVWAEEGNRTIGRIPQ